MPELRHAKTATEGRPYIVTCSVTHTCSSHVPKLTWSRSTTDGVTEVHREIHSGNWELQSIMTFIPEEKDDHSEVTCTATFNGEKTSSATLKLYLKRKIFSLCCGLLRVSFILKLIYWILSSSHLCDLKEECL